MYIDPEGLNNQKRQVRDLPEGFTAAVDQFNNRGVADFEIHIFDKNGTEVGILTKDGFINKHGNKVEDINLPKKVEDALNGLFAGELRKRNIIRPKGQENIKGGIKELVKKAAKVCKPMAVLDILFGADDMKRIFEDGEDPACVIMDVCTPGSL